MNLTQKQQVLDKIEEINSFDFDQFIIDSNTTSNLDDISFDTFNVKDFKSTFKKAMKQLQAEIENGLGLLLPDAVNFNNEYGNMSLTNELNTFNSYLKTFANKDMAGISLKRIIYYQVVNGFWNKSSVRLHRAETTKVNDIQEKLELVQKDLTKRIGVFESLEESYNTKLEELNETIKEKREELDSITTKIEEVNAKEVEMDTILQSSNEVEQRISEILLSADKEVVKFKELRVQFKEETEEIISSNKEVLKELTTSVDKSNETADNINESHNYIIEQKGTIEKLVGLAADGALGYKFNERKEAIEGDVNKFWKWAVPVTIALLIGWIIVVFTVLKSEIGNVWLDLIINLVKTTPFWLMVGFVISQYKKERDLEEEYSFKSAVAMTITSYSQMLSSDGEMSKSSRDEMLLKTIDNIYRKPEIKKNEDISNKREYTKELTETLGSFAEILKSYKK